MSTCVVAYEVLFLQTAGLGPRVLGLELFVGPTQVLNGDLRVPHLDQLQYRIVNEYVLTLERAMIDHITRLFAYYGRAYTTWKKRKRESERVGGEGVLCVGGSASLHFVYHCRMV